MVKSKKSKREKKTKELVQTRIVHGKVKAVDVFIDGEHAGGAARLTATKATAQLPSRVTYISNKRGAPLKIHETRNAATSRFPRITQVLRKKL